MVSERARLEELAAERRRLADGHLQDTDSGDSPPQADEGLAVDAPGGGIDGTADPGSHGAMGRSSQEAASTELRSGFTAEDAQALFDAARRIHSPESGEQERQAGPENRQG